MLIPKKLTGRVVVIDTAEIDSILANTAKGRKAHRGLRKFLKKDGTVTKVILANVIGPVNNMEVSKNAHWGKTLEECADLMEEMPYSEIVPTMFRTQMKDLDTYLRLLRRAVPEAEIIVMVRGAPVEDSVSYMTNSLLATRRDMIKDQQARLRGTQEDLTAKRRELEAELSQMRKDLTAATRQRDPVETSPQQIAGWKKRIPNLITKIEELRKQRVERGEEIKGFSRKYEAIRPSKIAATHQAAQAETVKGVIKAYRDVCDKHGVLIETKDFETKIGEKLMYVAIPSNSGKKPLKSADKGVVNGTWNRIAEANAIRRREGRPRIDGYVEVGTGKATFAMQRLTYPNSALNGFDRNGFMAKYGDNHVFVATTPQFVDQTKISDIKHGGEPERYALGRPMGSRGDLAIDQYEKGAPSGIMIFNEYDNGIVSAELIDFQSFIDGTASQTTYELVGHQSDTHRGANPSNYFAQIGYMEAIRHWTTNPFPMGGNTEAFVRSMVFLGDETEPASTKYPFWDSFRRHPRQQLMRTIEAATDPRRDEPDTVWSFVTSSLNDSQMGKTATTHTGLQWFADDAHMFREFINPASECALTMVIASGNHHGNEHAQSGAHEYEYILQGMRAMCQSYIKAGEPEDENLFPGSPARLMAASVGLYRGGAILNYGQSLEGKPYTFGPIAYGFHHDPKGPWMDGITGVFQRMDVGESNDELGDNERVMRVGASGHTHSIEIIAVRDGDNCMGFSIREGTLQPYTDVEMFFAKGRPRTAGAVLTGFPRLQQGRKRGRGQIAFIPMAGYRLANHGKRFGKKLVEERIRERQADGHQEARPSRGKKRGGTHKSRPKTRKRQKRA